MIKSVKGKSLVHEHMVVVVMLELCPQIPLDVQTIILLTFSHMQIRYLLITNRKKIIIAHGAIKSTKPILFLALVWTNCRLNFPLNS